MRWPASSRDDDKLLWDRAGPACLVSASLVVVGSLALVNMIWPLFGALFPLGFIGWFGTGVVALWQRQYRWVLAAIPILAVPFGFFGLLFVACLRGDCL